MSNNPRNQWGIGGGQNDGNYQLPPFENNNQTQPPNLPPISYPPIQPGPAPPITERQPPINHIHQPFQPSVLPLPQPHIQDRPFRPSIHQPILSHGSTNPQPPLPVVPIQDAGSPTINHNSESPESYENNLRPLNVRDALTYLDRVKIEFQNRPDIYNNFLEIMKDFKTQSLDTHGVIDRVATLFHGYPSLVIGFNTFLPPGFKIELSDDPKDRNGVRVIMPDDDENYVTDTRENYNAGGLESTSYLAPINHSNPPNANEFDYNPNLDYSDPPIQENHSAQQPIPRDEQGVQEGTDGKRKPPVEFNHAINYVNRIKNRFIRDPESYKHFLDILQLYSKDAKPIQEIYKQVRELFGNDQDLLNEFCQFLPDASSRLQDIGISVPSLSHHTQSHHMNLKPSTLNPHLTTGHQSNRHMSNVLPLIQEKLPPPHLGPTREYINPPLGPPLSVSEMFDRHSPVLPPVNLEANNDKYDPYNQGALMYKKKRTTLTTDKPNATLKVKKTKQLSKFKDNAGLDNPHMVYSAQLQEQARMLVPQEDVTNLEKIKKHIGHLPTYHEFLKVLGLYSQSIIDIDTLIETVENFIGNSASLFNWFKEFIGYQPKPEEAPSPGIPKPRLDLSQFKAFGPSYRQLPKAETTMKCSGRDALCNEVLNDEYASHPTWASEETVFVAHKKNAYEENLHKSEEDRFEIDFNMETNAHTIALLEPISKQIAKMPPEAIASFKLPPGLGGKSLTIYKRAIRKVYDIEADTVLDLLHDSPGTAIPVVLKRLKQKDQEWREIKKEWCKIWRDVDIKNYYRSLDYQTVQFKYNDRRNLNPKQLVTEIEAIKRETCDTTSNNNIPPKRNVLCSPQLTFNMRDLSIHHDIDKLLVCLLGAHNGLTANEKNRIVNFLKTFINNVFGIPFMENVEAFSNKDKVVGEDFDDNDSSKESEIEVALVPKRTRNRKSNNDASPSINKNDAEPNDDDIQEDEPEDKQVVEENIEEKEQTNEDNDPPKSPINPEPETKTEEGIKEEKINEVTSFSQLKILTGPSPPFSSDKKGISLLLCNGHIYSILRIYQVMYTRLEEVKKFAKKADVKFQDMAKLKTVSRELEIQPKFEVLEGVDLTAEGCFNVFLNLTLKVLEGEIEPPIYEDCLRFMLGNNIYAIFTIDKILNSFIKQVHALFLDINKSSFELAQLFQEVHKPNQIVTYKDLADYLLKSKKIFTNDENMYLIEYTNTFKTIKLQLFEAGELNLQTIKKAESNWHEYVANYSKDEPTPGITIKRKVFLERLLRKKDIKKLDNIIFEAGRVLRVSPQIYRCTVGEQGVEEAMFVKYKSKVIDSREIRNKKWIKLLEGPKGWHKNLSDKARTESNAISWLNVDLKDTTLVSNNDMSD